MPKPQRVPNPIYAGVDSTDVLERGHVLGGMEWDYRRFHPAPQNGVQFKTYEFFVSEIFHLIFLD
jgi:hypothetical protein